MTPGVLLLAASTLLALGVTGASRRPGLWLAATLAGAAAALTASVSILVSGIVWDGGFTLWPTGRLVRLELDALGAFFLALLALLGGLGSAYAHEYWSDRGHPASAPAGRFWWSAALLSMALVLLARNGVHFLVAWELFSISAYFLITLERSRGEVRSAGWMFLAASRAGTLCLVVYFAAIAGRTGSWELGPMGDRDELAPLFWLALAGFGLKAGMYPLHVWLPSAHANAPSHVSALLSGVALKMGIYGLVRFSGWIPVPDAAGWAVAALGVVSAVLGVAFALGQHDLKRLLAYHSVENVGIILIGLGFAILASRHGYAAWGSLALAGSFLHVWNHGLFKALLFLGAGSVVQATGTRDMSRLGGLWRAMPWTAWAFLLGAAAIAGLPPLNGFVSEWLVYVGLFGAMTAHAPFSWQAVPAVILLAVTGALALACFVKVFGVVFLGAPRTGGALRAHDCGWFMRVPMLVLAAGCVTIGLAPGVVWPVLAQAVSAWQPAWADSAAPVPVAVLGRFNLAFALVAIPCAAGTWLLVRRAGVDTAPTWDCGYVRPNVRMQYTAGSFAAIITGWFAWILRPQRHVAAPEGPFPLRAYFEQHTPETVLTRVVEPVGAVIMRVVHQVRRLQHGRLQAYVLYVLIGVAGIAILAVTGSR